MAGSLDWTEETDMPLSDARRERLQRIETIMAEQPGISQERLADSLDISQSDLRRDLELLGRATWGSRAEPARCQDLVLHGGVWCAICNCGERVPIIAEEGDLCPRCGLTLRVMVSVS